MRRTQLRAGDSMTGDARQRRKISSRPSQVRFAGARAELLDDAFLGQPLDLARAAAEQFGQDVHIVLAIAWRAAVYRAADIGRGFAELHRDFVDRPGADLRAGDFG